MFLVFVIAANVGLLVSCNPEQIVIPALVTETPSRNSTPQVTAEPSTVAGATPTLTPTLTEAPTPTTAPTAIPTLTLTPTPACPYQGRTDDETIANLIRAEAEAVNSESIAIIISIFVPDATFYDGDTKRSWSSPMERYQEDLFKNTDIRDAEHFDIRPAGPGVTGNTAWYTSGSRGYYKDGGVWKLFSNGSAISTSATATPAPYGSDHWTFGRDSTGCWVITRFAFNSGHIPFPP